MHRFLQADHLCLLAFSLCQDIMTLEQQSPVSAAIPASAQDQGNLENIFPSEWVPGPGPVCWKQDQLWCETPVRNALPSFMGEDT